MRQTQTQRETVSGWPFASDWSDVPLLLLCIDHFGPLRQGDVRHGLVGRNYGRRREMEGGRESVHCTTIYNLIRQQTWAEYVIVPRELPLSLSLCSTIVDDDDDDDDSINTKVTMVSKPKAQHSPTHTHTHRHTHWRRHLHRFPFLYIFLFFICADLSSTDCWEA